LANHLLRQHLPSLDLSLSYGKTNIDIAGDPQWASMAQLSIPLLNLKTVTDYQAQKQQVIIAEARLEKIRQEVMGQWESVLNRLRITVESARARGRGLGVARGLYEDNQRRLRLGRSSLNDVLVDQSRLADAEILAHQGWAAAHRVYTEYCHIQGLRAGCK
jgi:outer membrane protein TolC